MEDKTYSHRMRLEILSKAIDFVKHEMSVGGIKRNIDQYADEIIDLAKKFEEHVFDSKQIKPFE